MNTLYPIEKKNRSHIFSSFPQIKGSKTKNPVKLPPIICGTLYGSIWYWYVDTQFPGRLLTSLVAPYLCKARYCTNAPLVSECGPWWRPLAMRTKANPRDFFFKKELWLFGGKPHHECYKTLHPVEVAFTKGWIFFKTEGSHLLEKWGMIEGLKPWFLDE